MTVFFGNSKGHSYCFDKKRQSFQNKAYYEPVRVTLERHSGGVMNTQRILKKQSILGIGYNLISYRDVMDICDFWRDKGESHYVTFAPIYSISLCHRDRQMQKATEQASLTLPDGIGNVFAAHLLGYAHEGRVTAPLTMLNICDWGRERNYRHFFYGGAEGVAERLAQRLMRLYPGLNIAGTYCPPFRHPSERESRKIIDLINASMPDIVWVCLGAPKQEIWMADHIGRIEATVMMGVGAAFNFISGNIKWAPEWVRKLGLEWIYRTIQEPRHIWRRHLIIPGFFFSVIRQKYSKNSQFNLDEKQT